MRRVEMSMKKILLILIIIVCAIGVAMSELNTSEEQKEPTFEDAIALIKRFEGMSGTRHWPYIGYGHQVQKGEGFVRGKVLTEAQADKLLREDYAKLCARYREYGQDSLLLAALAYNCGPGVVAKSSVLKNLKSGNRDIETAYKAHCRYRGKVLKQLQRRRETELETLFVKTPKTIVEIADSTSTVGDTVTTVEEKIIEEKK